MSIKVNTITTLTLYCDSLDFECDNAFKITIIKGHSVLDVKRKATKKGWALKSTKCYCPNCKELKI